jgi:hypothetical protein
MGQAPQRPAQRSEQPRRANPASAPSKATQLPASDSDEPQHLYIEEGASGLLIGTWVKQAKERLDGQPEEFRRTWLESHLSEVDEVRRLQPEWADRLVAQAIAPDLPATEVAA